MERLLNFLVLFAKAFCAIGSLLALLPLLAIVLSHLITLDFGRLLNDFPLIIITLLLSVPGVLTTLLLLNWHLLWAAGLLIAAVIVGLLLPTTLTIFWLPISILYVSATILLLLAKAGWLYNTVRWEIKGYQVAPGITVLVVRLVWASRIVTCLALLVALFGLGRILVQTTAGASSFNKWLNGGLHLVVIYWPFLLAGVSAIVGIWFTNLHKSKGSLFTTFVNKNSLSLSENNTTLADAGFMQTIVAAIFFHFATAELSLVWLICAVLFTMVATLNLICPDLIGTTPQKYITQRK